MRQLEPDTDSHIAASPKPELAVARSSPSPNLDISVYDLTGLPGEGSQAPGSSNPVPNPAVVKQPVGKQHTLNPHMLPLENTCACLSRLQEEPLPLDPFWHSCPILLHLEHFAHTDCLFPVIHPR